MSTNLWRDCQELLNKCEGDPYKFSDEIIFTPAHAKQCELMLLNKRKNCIHTGHRFGKTIAIAMKHLYYCVYKIGVPLDESWYEAQYKTINVSFEYNMAQKVYDIIANWFTRKSPLLKEGGPIIKRTSIKDKKIEFVNGAEFYFSSLEENGKHVEGEAYRYMSIDEAGQEKSLGHIWEHTLKWRLIGASGFTDFVGTPKPWSDPFFEELSMRAIADPDVGHFTGSTYDNPYLPKEDLEEIEKDIKDYPHLRAMYLEGKFVPLAGRLLSRTQIENAIDYALPIEANEVKRLSFGTVSYQKDHTYVSFWDLAFTADWTVGITLDVTTLPWRQVNFTRVNRSNIGSWSEIWRLMGAERRNYHMNQVYYDATGPQGSIIQESITDAGVRAKPVRITAPSLANRVVSGKIGKNELINQLEMAFCYKQPVYDEANKLIAGELENWGKVRIPNIRQEVEELALYHREDKKLTTDCVIALAGACLMAKRAAHPPRYRLRTDNPYQQRRVDFYKNPARRAANA